MKVHGFILITVLIFLQLVTLLALCVMQMARIEAKSSHAIAIRHQLLRETEGMLEKIEKNTIHLSHCYSVPVSSDYYLKRPLEAWPCREPPYYYAIEPLGMDACGEMRYYRLTLLNQVKQYRIVLQTTTAILTGEIKKDCPLKVKSGRKMWREIS